MIARGERWYCPLSPCVPAGVARPDIYGGVSFSSLEAYMRHMERGHFIAPVNAPAPVYFPPVARESAA